MQSVKLLEDYQLFMYLFILWYPCCSVRRQCVCKPLKQYKSECLSVCNPLPLLLPRLPVSSLSGVQLQFLPCLPGAHGVCWGAELPAAASRRRQQLDLARWPQPEDSAHTNCQTTAAARHWGHPGKWTSTQIEQRQCGEMFSLNATAQNWAGWTITTLER